MTAVPMTENNRSLAEAVNKRINADGVMLAARASIWRLGGVGLMLMLIGIGIAAVLFAYSYIHDDQKLTDRMASSFAKALEGVKIPIVGTVEMTPGTVAMPEPGKVTMTETGKVTMERGTVEMTKPGEVIMKKPGVVTGTVVGTIDSPRPSEQQLTGSNPSNNRANMVTNYTIFKMVPFETGKVVTGWKFSSSEQSVPDGQYCYYDPNPDADVSQTNVLVRLNGQVTPQGKTWAAAIAQCVWFNGQQPSPR